MVFFKNLDKCSDEKRIINKIHTLVENEMRLTKEVIDLGNIIENIHTQRTELEEILFQIKRGNQK